jgi:hypothetical protein
MTKDQIYMLINNVRTDLEFFKLTGSIHYVTRAQKSLERLKKWRKEIFVNENLSFWESQTWLC